MHVSILLFISVLTASAAVSQVITLPMTKIKRTGGYRESLDAARARVALLKSSASSGSVTVPAVNLGYGAYTISVGIGNPPTNYSLFVDSGSSNTFCGTGIQYVQTPTSIPTGENMTVGFAIGYATGYEYLDQVTVGPGLVIRNQSIGVMTSSSSFSGVDGLMGIGPMILTGGTLPQEQTTMIPTVLNNLASQGVIAKQVVSFYFAPPNSGNDTNGALTFGGIDSSLSEGSLTYTPLTTTFPASEYWGINTTLNYGGKAIIPTSTAGIVDTGTTQILLADDFFESYAQAIQGASLDMTTGLITIPSSFVSQMQPLTFMINGTAFDLSVTAQLVQESLESEGAEERYSIVSKLGSKSGEGLDFILGYKFLERFYTVLDADGKRVGFAQTNYTSSTFEG